MTSAPANPPLFMEGVQYRRFGTGRWKWVLNDPVRLRFDGLVTKWREAFRGVDRGGREWLNIRRDTLTIPAGYAWNGSSWSPDLPGVMLASCVHDALYQFSGCDDWPKYLDREWADSVFHNLATTRLRFLYSLGLALGSWACWARKPVDGERVVKYHYFGKDDEA